MILFKNNFLFSKKEYVIVTPYKNTFLIQKNTAATQLYEE